jgi:hypothetical protein
MATLLRITALSILGQDRISVIPGSLDIVSVVWTSYNPGIETWRPA